VITIVACIKTWQTQTRAPNLPGIRIPITIFSCSGPAVIWRDWFLKPYPCTQGRPLERAAVEGPIIGQRG
jgi:hypothetical protein